MTLSTLRRSALPLALLAGLPAMAQELPEDGFKVALDGTFAPHAMPKLDGGVEGFNVDLAAAIGETLGTDMEVVAAQFSGLIPALQAGTYDFLVAPTTVTEERASSLLFTEGFMDTNFAFTVPAGSDEMEGLEAFEGMTIAVNKGSVYEAFLTERAEEYGWDVVAYGTNTDAVEAVATGRAEANMAGATVSAWAAKQNPRVDLSYEYDTGLVWAFPFRKDDVETRNMIDRVLECLKTDGTMAELSEKWFGVTPEEGRTIVTPTPGYGTPDFEGYDDTEHEVSCEF